MTESIAEPAYKKRVSYHGTLLAGFATLAATFLVMGNLSTHKTIELRLAEDLQASLSQVIPASLHDNNLLDNQINLPYQDKQIVIYQGIKNDKTTAVAYSVSGQGYAGEIALIIGVKASGEILGVRVLSHTETPGLGDKIEVERDDWMFSFDGLSFENLAQDKWKVKKDGGEFDQFSGATITPRTVVKAVKEGLDLFNLKRDKFLAINKPAVTDTKEKSKSGKVSTKSSNTSGAPHE